MASARTRRDEENPPCSHNLVGGELPEMSQATTTTQDSDLTECSSKRAHHRLLEECVPLGIEFCKNAIHMMHVVSDAFLVHEEAYQLGYLHRDVSVRNVLVAKTNTRAGTEVEGILVDWDLCLNLKKEGGETLALTKSKQRFRAGTWYFMSAALLQDPNNCHLLRDDLESFLHLVLYLSLLWFNPVNLELPSVEVIVRRVFQQAEPGLHGSIVGGTNKKMMIRDHEHLGFAFRFFENPALTSWVKQAINAFGMFYSKEPIMRKARLAAKQRLVSGTPSDTQVQDDVEIVQQEIDALPINDHSLLKKIFRETLAMGKGLSVQEDMH